MTRFLFWLGDQIERGVPADRADLTPFETLCYRLSQRIYRAAGMKALTEQERLEWGKRFLRIWRKLDEEEAHKVSEVIARQKATRKVNTEAAPK